MATHASFIEHGVQLIHAAKQARESAWIVSPFIKSSALRRVMDVLDASVPLTVVTRWRLDELAVGVSDLSVFDDCGSRPNCRLLLCNDLHAKYFRMDQVAFIGSANLTGAGMGWVPRSNIEILEPVDASARWFSFETDLLASSFMATVELRDAIAAALLETPKPLSSLSIDATAPNDSSRISCAWVPLCRDPSALKFVYFGDTSNLVSTLVSAAKSDLADLGMPPGVKPTGFDHYVRCAMLQEQLLRTIDKLITDTPRFGELRIRLSNSELLQENSRDPTDALQCIMRWLMHFFPDRYVVKVYNFSECLGRRES